MLTTVVRISSQHFNLGLTYFQRCGSILKIRWSDVENETKFDVEFSALHKVTVRHWNNFYKTLHNVDTTLYQRCFNVVWMLILAISNPIGLVMIMGFWVYNFFLFCEMKIVKNVLAMVHILIHNGGNNFDMHRSLKYWI